MDRFDNVANTFVAQARAGIIEKEFNETGGA
jgi:hypothetical protein